MMHGPMNIKRFKKHTKFLWLPGFHVRDRDLVATELRPGFPGNLVLEGQC
jgi:hypothetical protein